MEEFSDFIFEQGLMDLPLWGGSFTLGLTIETPPYGLELMGFSFLLIGRFTFRTLFRVGYPDFFYIISLYFMTAVIFKG
jgi:hypothetical protein